MAMSSSDVKLAFCVCGHAESWHYTLVVGDRLEAHCSGLVSEQEFVANLFRGLEAPEVCQCEELEPAGEL
jgi:hypothetical protein